MTKTHWKNLANYDYLGAYSLDNQKEITLTIESVKKERVTAVGGNSEDCIVASFVEKELNGVVVKPMVFNKTNCKTVAALYGDFVEDWVGKRITIFATTTKFQRDVVPCLRIKKEVPAGASVATSDSTKITSSPITSTPYKCVVCGKQITKDFFDKSVAKYGAGICSKECLDVYSSVETNMKEEANN